MSPRREPFELGGTVVRPGTRKKIELPIAKLPSGTSVGLPVMVLHGRAEGPTISVSAAVHGDEINGIEIIRRVLAHLDPRTMAGTVLAVPTVNVFGFLSGDRYLPDRRDLNRSFPGSYRGSLAARIAYLFFNRIVTRCDAGIDLHTGSDGRTNLPQIRADLSDPTTRELALAFAPPIMLNSATRDGSVRAAAAKLGLPMLLFEGGEANRYDEAAITAGEHGLVRVMGHLGVLDAPPPPPGRVIESHRSRWVRARRSGLALPGVALGDEVSAGDPLAVIHDTFGARLGRITSPVDGIVIGRNEHPLVNQGDALIHIAEPLAPASDLPDQPADEASP